MRQLPESFPDTVNTLTKAILLTLAVGALLTTAILAPNAVQLFKPFLKNGKRSNYDRERVRVALRSLERRGLITDRERNGKREIQLTKQGRIYVKQLQLGTFKLPKEEKWDGTWRLILFDIPERKGKARRAFQQHLKSLHCFPLQKSVFVYPYDCREEMNFLTSFWDVHPNVHYLETHALGRSERAVCTFFQL